MRTFKLVRNEDLTGISGTGFIAEGIEFSNGKVALMWNRSNSLGLFDTMQEMLNVHGHNGSTTAEFI